jgi:hypothetical protein
MTGRDYDGRLKLWPPEPNGRVNRALRELSDEPNMELSTKARSIIQNLLIYNDNATGDDAWQTASAALIEVLSEDPQHIAQASASICLNQAECFRSIGDAEQALRACEHALLLRPDLQ